MQRRPCSKRLLEEHGQRRQALELRERWQALEQEWQILEQRWQDRQECAPGFEALGTEKHVRFETTQEEQEDSTEGASWNGGWNDCWNSDEEHER